MLRSGRAGRALAIATTTLLLGTTVATTWATAEPPINGQPEAPSVDWGPCSDADLGDVSPPQRHLYSCATYAVPLDHSEPAAGTVDIALMRRAASNPAEKVGSLFLNPGGPGGSGFNMPTSAPDRFDPEVLERFDVVGFDPRGIDRSTRFRCFESAEQKARVLEGSSTIPRTGAEMESTLDAFGEQGDLCEHNAGALRDNMATADVARDLDLLRAAVGDERLNYVGFSYGTLLGATYVAMFPERSRAILLDGNVDPRLRTADGVRYDQQRARGFELALDGFLRECAKAGERCAFSEGDPREKFDDLRTRLHAGPVTMPDGTEITLEQFTSAVASALYDIEELAPLAVDLQTAYQRISPEVADTAEPLRLLAEPAQRARYDGLPRQREQQQEESYVDDSYLGVNCTDKPLPREPGGLPAIAAAWERESPTFGRYQAFSDVAACAQWPELDADVHSGPWKNESDNPVLVFGNYYDPATQYAFSKRMTEQLGNARLVSADAFGHCILGESACADRIAARYLVDLRTPPPGKLCQSDAEPFS